MAKQRGVGGPTYAVHREKPVAVRGDSGSCHHRQLAVPPCRNPIALGLHLGVGLADRSAAYHEPALLPRTALRARAFSITQRGSATAFPRRPRCPARMTAPRLRTGAADALWFRRPQDRLQTSVFSSAAPAREGGDCPFIVRRGRRTIRLSRPKRPANAGLPVSVQWLRVRPGPARVGRGSKPGRPRPDRRRASGAEAGR
jgi:hypothetical protein